ncbi:MAG TPA: hypothetical protein VKB19_07740 [Pedobacter sp.]|nr:hypothetical protein [Pedobacter sp.]
MYTYKLSADDLVNGTIYSGMSDAKTLNKRNKSSWFLIGLCSLLAIVGYLRGDLAICAVLVALAIFYLVILVGRKSISKKAMRKTFNTTYPKLADTVYTLEIKSDHLHLTNMTGDVNYKFTGIALIAELGAHFFVKLIDDNFFCIPKISDELEEDIRSMVAAHNIPYKEHLDWQY